MKYVTSTSTARPKKYEDDTLSDIYEYVYKATSEEDAMWNAKRIIRSHERGLSLWKLLKLIWNKL